MSVVTLALGLVPALCAAAPPAEAPSYRIFLTDGTPLVSFGEFSRASGRVVFTLPIGSPARPDSLQVVTLPESAVDWERTERYTGAVRHWRYAQTRGEEDYAALTGAVARALGEMGFAPDASSKLAIAADIRRQLLDWPATHFGYRSSDVRDLTALVEEAISEIRAGSGQRAFDLSLVATIEPPAEPLLPEPTLRDSLTFATAVAEMTEPRRERTTLQRSILAVLKRRPPELPHDWYTATRKSLSRTVEREDSLDRDYGRLASRVLSESSHYESHADVGKLERLAVELRQEDGRLGYQRPDTVKALSATLAIRTNNAREFVLATQRYEQRRSAYGEYRKRINASLEKFDDVMDDITALKNRAAISTRRLGKTDKRVAVIDVSLLPLGPPAELKPAHDLLISSARLMREAIRLQRLAAAPGDASAGDNASAAAAGALLLLDTARHRVDEFFRRPVKP